MALRLKSFSDLTSCVALLQKVNAVLAKETLSEQTMQSITTLSRVKLLERDTRSQWTTLNDALQELEELRKKSVDFDMILDTELSKLRKEWPARHFETQAQ